jgi:hypothetical protein
MKLILTTLLLLPLGNVYADQPVQGNQGIVTTNAPAAEMTQADPDRLPKLKEVVHFQGNCGLIQTIKNIDAWTKKHMW